MSLYSPYVDNLPLIFIKKNPHPSLQNKWNINPVDSDGDLTILIWVMSVHSVLANDPNLTAHYEHAYWQKLTVLAMFNNHLFKILLTKFKTGLSDIQEVHKNANHAKTFAAAKRRWPTLLWIFLYKVFKVRFLSHVKFEVNRKMHVWENITWAIHSRW